MKIERITAEPITADGHDATPRPGRVWIDGRPVTLYLESALWKLLRSIAAEQGLTLEELCERHRQRHSARRFLCPVGAAYMSGATSASKSPTHLLPARLRAIINDGEGPTIQ